MALHEEQGHKDCQALTAWGAGGGLETGPGRGPERPWGLFPLLPFPRNLVWKNAEGWHLREAVPCAWAGRAQLGPAS